MKFGIFFEIPVPVRENALGTYSEQALYNATLDQVVTAEKHGFSVIWLPKHRYNIDYSHISAPEIVLMKLAKHTSTIHLGPEVVVIPINHPVTVAERYATLDLLSNGRLELGWAGAPTCPGSISSR